MSSVLIQNQQSLLALKNVLKGGAGQFGWTDQAGGAVAGPTFWTVDYSGNGVSFGAVGDGVDRWSVYTDLDWSADGATHSWMVLKNTQGLASGTLYWLLALQNSGSDSNTIYMSVSKVGYTGGNATSKPTAADEQVMRNFTYWGSGGGAPIRFHILMSDDGRATRVFTTYQTGLNGVWLIETMLDATTNVESDLFASAWSQSAANNIGANSLTQTPQSFARTVGGNTIYGVLSGEGSKFASNANVALLAVDRTMWNDVAAANQLMAVGAWGAITSAPAARGHMGSLVDLWWGSDVVPCGQSFPDNYSRSLVTMGPLVIPWNTTKPKVF
jgi:hypothetical protein